MKGISGILSEKELRNVTGGFTKLKAAGGREDEGDSGGGSACGRYNCSGSCSHITVPFGTASCQHISFSDGSEGCACV